MEIIRQDGKPFTTRQLGCIRAWLARLDELGATDLGDPWEGNLKRRRIRCSSGHVVAPRPGNVTSGQGACRTCVGNDPERAWLNFKEYVANAGGEVLEHEWLGDATPHRVRCAYGHDGTAVPTNTRQTRGICRVCAGKSPKQAWADFRQRVADQGGVVLEPEWLGALKPHRVLCRLGHEVTPQPSSLHRGSNLCRVCVNRDKRACDAFYIVQGSGVVKFGITCRDGRDRIGQHRRDGHDRQVLLRTSLPYGVAYALEQEIRQLLDERGIKPVRGHEYFLDGATDFIKMVALDRLG